VAVTGKLSKAKSTTPDIRIVRWPRALNHQRPLSRTGRHCPPGPEATRNADMTLRRERAVRQHVEDRLILDGMDVGPIGGARSARALPSRGAGPARHSA